MREDKNYATSLFEIIIAILTGSAECWHPSRCALCGGKRKGNFITGYYFACDKWPNHY